jgi:NaMN:DMB phosphoribosyltransferase
METGARPGGDPAAGPAVPGAKLLWDSGFSLGRLLAGLCERLVIGESCTGNGVTSRLTLRALGYRADVLEDFSSGKEGSSPWERASSRLGIRPGDMIGHGFEAATELGDPVLVTATAITAGAMGGPDILLAGGLPMLAVSAILRDMGEKGRISISTTTRTEEDLGGAFGTISELLDLQVQRAEIGSVPDGAGASGAVLLSGKYDITPERVLQRVSYLCDEISDQGPGPGKEEQ